MTYFEEELLREIKLLMEDEEIFAIYQRAYEEFKPLINNMNRIVLKVYKYNDHGIIHALLTTRRSLEIYKILKKKGYKMTAEELGGDERWSKFIISLGSLLHDVGNAVHRKYHYLFSVILVKDKVFKYAKELVGNNDYLLPAYLTLNAIFSHDEDVESITMEASIITMADGLDIEAGRSRLRHDPSTIDIHSVSAYSIDKVLIEENDDPEVPLKVVIYMNNLAGVFQVDEILRKKVENSLLTGRVLVEIITNDKRMIRRI
ncbi:MAG: metal-dependent phosphohydrolase [Thermoplasmata archaeon]|nr:metal-dependent phosphohydrolase [Euryarchaeota archaeon]RLF67091.1 MAG: metal-dependent phosphohydrolase [Thermoplasmata archaeon]